MLAILQDEGTAKKCEEGKCACLFVQVPNTGLQLIAAVSVLHGKINCKHQPLDFVTTAKHIVKRTLCGQRQWQAENN